MPKIKLTKSEIDRLSVPVGKSVIYYDSELTGFGLRVNGGGTKTFIAERNLGNTKKTRRITIGKYGIFTTDQARKEAQKLLVDLTHGVDPNKAKRVERAKKITLRQCLDDYLAARGNLAANTRKQYQSDIKTGFAHWLNLPLEEITETMVEAENKRIFQQAQRAGRKGDAWNAKLFAVLQALFNFAISEYMNQEGQPIISRNPVQVLTRRKQWRKYEDRSVIVQEHQLPAFMDYLQTIQDANLQNLITFILLTGCRRNEARELVWDEVDLKGGLINLPAARTKNKTRHTFPLSSQALAILKQQGHDRITRGPGLVFQGFYSTSGIGKETLAAAVREAGKAAGIEDLHPHDLRRSFITYASELVPGLHVSRLANHSKKTVTEKYIQTPINKLRASTQLVSDFVFEAARTTDDKPKTQPDTRSTSQ